MFRKNEGHKQQSFFSVQNFLPQKTWEELLNTWAWTFYQEVFSRLDETIFAPLYSEKDSRPNVPVNVLVCLEILKSGFGWSDEELHEQAKYNLQIRLALGLHNLKEEIFTERTIYNFRRRVREYAAETGVNLIQKAFEQITDAQLEELCLETGWQRMDSTQVLSNLARMTRLEPSSGSSTHGGSAAGGTQGAGGDRPGAIWAALGAIPGGSAPPGSLQDPGAGCRRASAGDRA
jgi:hypothetical protein